jgi:hypothetical protein
MDIVLKLLSNMSCIKKADSNEEKINCLVNRIDKLEHDVSDVYHKKSVDDKIENIKENNKLQLKNIENSHDIKLKGIQDYNEIRLKNIDIQQLELKEFQNEIMNKLQNNSEKLSSISGFLERKTSSRYGESMSRRIWR